MPKYVDKFLNLKCAGDIIGIAGPIKKYEKEITKAMAIKEVVIGNLKYYVYSESIEPVNKQLELF